VPSTASRYSSTRLVSSNGRVVVFNAVSAGRCNPAAISSNPSSTGSTRCASTNAAATVPPLGPGAPRNGWSRISCSVIQSRSPVRSGCHDPRLKITGTGSAMSFALSRSSTNRVVSTVFPDPARPSTTSRLDSILR
jgi:hypothetical protein